MLSDNLLSLRKQHKLSQEQVAEQIGVSRQAVAKWESGESIPDLENCCALAKLYDVSLDDLVSYDQSTSGGFPLPPKGKHMFGLVTIGERGQIVIPAKARRIFQLQPGDELVLLGDINQGLALIRTDFMLEMLNQFKEEGKS